MLRTTFLIASLLIPTIALAGDEDGGAPIPIYDVDASCAHVTGANTSSGRLYVAGCVRSEQDQYDLVRAFWTDLSPQHRSRCIGIVRGNAARYTQLAACVQGELAKQQNARDAAITPKFRP